MKCYTHHAPGHLGCPPEGWGGRVGYEGLSACSSERSDPATREGAGVPRAGINGPRCFPQSVSMVTESELGGLWMVQTGKQQFLYTAWCSYGQILRLLITSHRRGLLRETPRANDGGRTAAGNAPRSFLFLVLSDQHLDWDERREGREMGEDEVRKSAAAFGCLCGCFCF